MNAAPNYDIRSRQGLIQRVVDVLRSQITSGAWPVGARIPTEPELTDLTGVGRNTVREAVQSLVHSGLLERRQGSGTYVLANNEVVVQMTRASEAVPDGSRDAWDAFHGALIQAVALACERRTSTQAEDLSEATLDLIGDPATLIGAEADLPMASASRRVHPLIQAIFEAAHCPLLTDIAAGLLTGLGTKFTLEVPGQALLDCAQLIVSRDADRAVAICRRIQPVGPDSAHDVA